MPNPEAADDWMNAQKDFTAWAGREAAREEQAEWAREEIEAEEAYGGSSYPYSREAFDEDR